MMRVRLFLVSSALRKSQLRVNITFLVDYVATVQHLAIVCILLYPDVVLLKMKPLRREITSANLLNHIMPSIHHVTGVMYTYGLFYRENNDQPSN